MRGSWTLLVSATLVWSSSCTPPAPGAVGTLDHGPISSPDVGQPDAGQVCEPLASARAEPLAYGYSVNVAWEALSPGDALQIVWEDGEVQASVLVDGARGAHVVIGLTPRRSYVFRLTRRCAGGVVSAPLELEPVTTGEELAFRVETTVPYVGSETELVLFNCSHPLAGEYARSAIAAVTRDGQVQWAWTSPDGRAVTDVDWVPERGSLIASVWGTFTEIGLDGTVRLAFPGVYHHDLDFTPIGFTALYYRLYVEEVEYSPRVTEGIAVLDPDSGEVLWDWHLDEHIAPDDYHPESIKVSYFGVHDWTHANDLDYLPAREQFVINLRNLDRALFVDYPSGRVAAAMGSGTGLCEGIWSHAHEIVWLDLAREGLKGRFLMFDNGNYRDPPYSRVIEVEVDAAARSCAVVWEYRETPDFFAEASSAAYRLESGDTLITDGVNGRLLQVDRQGNKRWEARVPGCEIYQAKPVPRAFFQPAVLEH